MDVDEEPKQEKKEEEHNNLHRYLHICLFIICASLPRFLLSLFTFMRIALESS
jgi:hypothetical protein